MKIFDLHTDILYDLYTSWQKGESNRFTKYHLPQLNNSLVVGGIWTLYSPEDFDLKEAVKISLAALPKETFSNFLVVLGFEGLRNLLEPEDIQYFYDLGFRHASLTWNEENKYATGVAGYSKRGLTTEGKRLLKKMNELDMIVDLAHLNEKSFYDIIDFGCKNIMFSHGNLKALCDHRRNITDEQLKALKAVDGLIGLTLAGNFVTKEKDQQTTEKFLDHIDRAVELVGVDNVSFGFDFMDYFTEEFPDSNLRDIKDVRDVHIIVNGMRKRGYQEEEISKICYDNFYRRYKSKIYKGESCD